MNSLKYLHKKHKAVYVAQTLINSNTGYYIVTTYSIHYEDSTFLNIKMKLDWCYWCSIKKEFTVSKPPRTSVHSIGHFIDVMTVSVFLTVVPLILSMWINHRYYGHSVNQIRSDQICHQ